MGRFNKYLTIIILAIFFNLQLSKINAGITVPSESVKTISMAILKSQLGDTIWVKPGVYKEHITLKPGIFLISQELHQAIIDGKGRGDVVTMSYNSCIANFSIKNGNAGIISRHPENIISRCKIYKNRGSGIICTGNLPKIENNIIVFNDGSGIQGLDIISGVTSINHNTIAFNGNNGIVFKGSIFLTIENNIIASNGKSGIRLNPDDKKTVITYNLFFNNHHFKYVLPEQNFAFDPLFIAPKRRTMDFRLQPDSKALKRGNDNKNLGALF